MVGGVVDNSFLVARYIYVCIMILLYTFDNFASEAIFVHFFGAHAEARVTGSTTTDHYLRYNGASLVMLFTWHPLPYSSKHYSMVTSQGTHSSQCRFPIDKFNVNEERSSHTPNGSNKYHLTRVRSVSYMYDIISYQSSLVVFCFSCVMKLLVLPYIPSTFVLYTSFKAFGPQGKTTKTKKWSLDAAQV